VLRASPYRGIAASLYGFAPSSRWRLPLSFEDHAAIMSELLHDVVARERPQIAILAGFSSGGDLGFRMITGASADRPLPIDGFLALGPNVALETCFVSRPFAELAKDTEPSIQLMRGIDSHVLSLQEWVQLHEYLVRILRKFAGDLSALQRHAQDVVRPFSEPNAHPFDRWFRDASERVPHIRCVFEETPLYTQHVQRIRLRNLDHGVLGPHYREGSIALEPATEHFGLTEPGLVQKHVDALLAEVRADRMRRAPAATKQGSTETTIGA
jgi:hypothetical protein